MCVILYKPRGVVMDLDLFDLCARDNPDGIGFAFPAALKLVGIMKALWKTEELINSYKFILGEVGDKDMVFHFRKATAGKIIKPNCHPFRIVSSLAFCHKGHLTCVDPDPKGVKSDTVIFRDRYLKGMKAEDLNDTALLQKISDFIGKDNTLVFLNAAGKVAVCNDNGFWKYGIWFSNQIDFSLL